MIRKNMRNLYLIFAAMAISAPAMAAQPPTVQPMDLSVYDAMPRVGEAQLVTDPYCDQPDTLAASLIEDYAEAVVLSTRNPNGTRFDFWASAAGGTWTVSYTRADGVACVVGSGIGWQKGDSAGARMQQIGLSL